MPDGDTKAAELHNLSVKAGDASQQLSVNLGDRTPGEVATILRELNRAVFGDNLGWDGVVQQLRQIRKEVEQLSALVSSLQTEVSILKREVGERAETSRQMRFLLWFVAVCVFLLVGVTLWPVLS